jgi:hypothetical protein
MQGNLLVTNSSSATPVTDESGTTGGFSLGVSWNSKFRDAANYYAALKLKSYKTELSTLSIQKDISILSFGFVFPL